MVTKTTLELELKSNLIEQAKHAKSIKDSLEAAARARIADPLTAPRTSMSGGRTPASTYRDQREESRGYGVNRSIGPGTGAEGRDFAKQAQGLGGLVHVYATFAANLFAVSAAFTALSRAADTSNMVKGLDQLGASSGRALGSLSKQLMGITDGAISMREAMTATVQASAGGMTNAAILRMGMVAKQASQALGVAMPDALSRISRGITKLEPELLDEIGIMVRVDRSAEAYALTLGKTASALTDFEKRQGFANAVLEQGEKKFGAIKLDTNPYDKILASMKNLAQTGLELVNNVLGPLINLLASSPTALSVAMAGIGAILLKQAIPAIGMFRETARRMSEETTARVKRQVVEQREAAVQLDVLAAKRAETEYLTTGTGLKKIQALKDASFNSKIMGADVRGALKKSPLDLTPEESAKILSKHKELQDKIASGTASKGESDQYTKLEARAVKVKEINASISKVGDAAAAVNERKDSAWWTHQRQKEAYLKKLEFEAKKSSVVSNAAENAAVMGPSIAFKTLKSDLSSLEGSNVSKIGTAVKGTFAIATSAVTTFMNSIGGVLMIVGLVTAAFGLLASWLSTNSKEADRFSSSITGVSDAVDNLKRTIDFITDKDPLTVFSVETIQARASALQGLSDSLKSLVKDFNAVQKASSAFDSFMDGFWDSIGKGSADKLSTNLAKSISAGLEGAATSAAKSEGIKKLQYILGKNIDVTNIDVVTLALRKLNNPEVAAAGAAIDKILRDISLSANNAASTLTAATARITELSALVQAQNLALTPTDAVGKLGTAMVSSASEIYKGLQDPINSLILLNKLAKDSRALSLLSPNVSSDLISASSEIQKLNDNYGSLQQQLINGEKALQDLKAKNKAEVTVGNTYTGTTKRVDTSAATDAKAYIANIQNALVEAEAKMKAVGFELSSKVANDFVNIGLSKLNLSLKAAMSEGGITAARGYLSVLKEAGVGTAAAETKLAQQELGMQKQILEASYSQMKAQQRNTNALEILTISNQIVAANLVLADAGNSELRRDKAYKELSGLETQLENIVKNVRITEMKPKDVLALKAGGEFSAEVLAGMAPYMTQLTGYLSGLATIGGKAAAIAIQGFANLDREKLKQGQAENNTRIGSIDTELQTLNNAIALNVEYDKTLQTKKDTLETEKLNKQMKNDLLKYDSDKRIIGASSKSSEVNQAEVTKALDAAKLAWQARIFKFQTDTNAATQASRIIEQKGLEDIRLKQQANFELVRTETQTIAGIKLTQQADEIKYLETIGALTGSVTAAKLTQISLNQQAIDDENKRVEIASKYVTSYIALQNSKNLPLTTAVEKEKIEAMQKLLEASYLRQIDAQNLLNQGKVTSITLAGKEEVLAKSYAEQMERMVGFTETLAGAFGDVGAAIGEAGQAILKMGKADQDYLKQKLALQTKLATSSTADELNPAEIAKDRKNLIKLDKEKTISELDGYAKTAGAAKKMFGEKTLAYKVLGGVEKALHIAKLGMQAAQIVADLTGTASSVTNSSVRTTASVAEAGVDGVKAVVKAISSLPFPLNLAAGAATAAVVAGLISSIGGKSPAAPGAPTVGTTSEDRQATQGTGQSWVNGAKVDNGGGVFGDSSAKSTGIMNSLEILKDNSIIGLSYDNRMTKALEKLASSIVEAAKSIYGIRGLRDGSGFGTMQGSTVGGRAGLMGSIFGGKTTSNTSITSAGIQFQGTFNDVMDNVSGSILQYKDILSQFTKSGGWFSKDKSWSTKSTEVKGLAEGASASISNIFKEANNMFIEVGKKAGVSAEHIRNVLSQINVSMSADLMNLTGQALVDELNGIIGNQISNAASTIFSSFAKYKNFGEDFLTTVIRVIDANDKVDQALRSIGSSFSIISNFDISEAMVNAAGGLSQFMEQTATFGDAFLTDAERLAPIQKALKTQLNALGLSTNLSRDQFKNLVLAQDLSSEAGRNMYQNLMELVPGFDKVTSTIDETTKTLKAALVDLDIAIYTELGKAEIALQLTREKEIEALDASVRPIQKYLNTLKDETSLKTKLTKAYTDQSTAIKNTISSLTGSIKSLKEYKTSLTAGASSLLTPSEKYAQAQATMLQTTSLARSTITSDSTSEEIAARNDAISKVSSTSDAFLSASKEMFASSDRYIQDFAGVLELLDGSSLSLTQQLSTAEKQLVTLDESISFLKLITTSTDTTASLLQELLVLQVATAAARTGAIAAGSGAAASVYAIPAMAGGGVANGLTLVGEDGPELANFTSTARIYPNQASNDMFNTKELVAEIRSLRAEVSQLRADQKQQTGHLIATNYDANSKNAAAVVNATEEASDNQDWRIRSQVKIA